MNENDFNYKDINVQVYQLLEDLKSVGMQSAPRGQKVVEATLCTLEIDPLLSIMNFENRKFNYKYFAGELAWYLKRDTSTDFILNFSTFWENIKNPDGSINSNYGAILLGDHPSNGKNQLEWVYNSLVKDEYSRQAIAFLNSPHYQVEGNKDFVCTSYINFWIRKDYIDMKVQMRSNDIFFGLTYDAPWFSLLHQSMFLNLKKVYPNLKLGTYFHCADNIHYYEKHFETVDQIVENSPLKSTNMTLKDPLFEFENGKISLSQYALSYLKDVERAVENKEQFADMKYADWKLILNSLINFND